MNVWLPYRDHNGQLAVFLALNIIIICIKFDTIVDTVLCQCSESAVVWGGETYVSPRRAVVVKGTIQIQRSRETIS